MKIVLTGSIAFDFLMTFPGYFREHILPEHLESLSLSFLVESMIRQPGGIAPNIAYTLALFGEQPKLWATVGEDFEGYRQRLDAIGIDTTGARVIPGEYTASFFVNTDRANSQIASFYPGAMAYAAQLSLRELAGDPPDLVVVSPNDPAAMGQYVRECQELNFPYVYDPSQQLVRLAPEEVLAGISGALALFVNDYEFELIKKMNHLDAAQLLARLDRPGAFVVVTRGEHGADIYTGDQVIHTPAVPPEHIVDPTGVGDAFRGGFLTGYSRGLDWDVCGKMGALAATYCLEQRGTQTHRYTPDEFVARYRLFFDDAGKLDIFMAYNTPIKQTRG